ncbi:MAG: gamma-glutamyltransferase [Sphingobacteriales bacterium]|nr:MAG: gamma-glutamyltransferase [Sphingobacteriales bacterium]
MKNKGIIAAGHAETAKAGAEILNMGGNAYDSVVGAFIASFVCEPTYISAGGGGFMLARNSSGKAVLFDFFAQTPLQKRPENEIDFRKVTLHFGDNTQDFHIGMASMVVPGNIAGIFHIHKQLGRLPFSEVVAPALALAKKGVLISPFLHYTMQLLHPILTASETGRSIFTHSDGTLKKVGEPILIPHLDDTLFALSKEGARLFYEGEIGQQIVQDCLSKGGYLTTQDFSSYRVIERIPLKTEYRGHTIFTNPPPSSGGSLIAFALQLLQTLNVQHKFKPGSNEYLRVLSDVFSLTNLARKHEFDPNLYHPEVISKLLNEQTIAKYAEPISSRLGNTTHISVADSEGNTAALTHSSGAGSDYFVPGTGMMLNNMLGEADLNPHGFHRWHNNLRLSSMMSPTLLVSQEGNQTILGSSGSSRIRSALVQVVSLMLDFGLTLQEAVNHPRIHLEGHQLNIEYGFLPEEISKLTLAKGQHKTEWQSQNMYFGGVNAVSRNIQGHFSSAADERRSGAVVLI